MLRPYVPMYNGFWDEEKFGHLKEITGYTSKNLNKWFWDQNKKEDNLIVNKSENYPEIIFWIYNMKTR